MWQYTTETIINSNKGNLEGGVRALIVDNADDNEKVLLIDGVGSYVKKYVKRVTKYGCREAKNEEAEITVVAPTLASGQTSAEVRLTVALREEGRQSSIMQDAYLHHSKPFRFEVTALATDSAANIAAKLVKVIKKTLALSDFKFFTVNASEAKLTLKAADCHIRFISVALDQIGASADLAAKITGFEDHAALAAGKVTVAGDCGAGTVEHLIKDLRIPTNASINPFGADQGGRPIPGGQYDQYLIEYETPRAHVAHGVMGSVGEISRTSHVLFLEKTGAAEIATLIETFAGVGKIEGVTKQELTKVKHEDKAGAVE